jgi:hypothetical protein
MFNLFKKAERQQDRYELVHHGSIFFVRKNGQCIINTVTTNEKEAQLFFDHITKDAGGQLSKPAILQTKKI